MMLAPTLAGNTPRTATRRRWRATHGIALDLALLTAGLAICAALFFQGGLEALIGAGAGALLSARNATAHTSRAAVSGAIAGLFVGAMFAGFFHGALAALMTTIF